MERVFISCVVRFLGDQSVIWRPTREDLLDLLWGRYAVGGGGGGRGVYGGGGGGLGGSVVGRDRAGTVPRALTPISRQTVLFIRCEAS